MALMEEHSPSIHEALGSPSNTHTHTQKPCWDQKFIDMHYKRRESGEDSCIPQSLAWWLANNRCSTIT
jgi:hypothetical protein